MHLLEYILEGTFGALKESFCGPICPTEGRPGGTSILFTGKARLEVLCLLLYSGRTQETEHPLCVFDALESHPQRCFFFHNLSVEG